MENTETQVENGQEVIVKDYIMIGVDQGGGLSLVCEDGFNPTIQQLLLYKEFMSMRVNLLLDNTSEIIIGGLKEIYSAINKLKEDVETLKGKGQ